MYHNGSALFNLSKGNFRQRIVNTFGGKTKEKLVPVEETTEVLGVSGFVGKARVCKEIKRGAILFCKQPIYKKPLPKSFNFICF